MQKDTIVFLNIYPLGKVFAESLGMRQFGQAGYNLIYLDLSKMYYPETYSMFNSQNKKYVEKKDFFIECETREETLNLIKKYSKRAWFFFLPMHIYQHFNQLWINRAFKKYKCDYFLQDFFPVHHGLQTEDKSLRIYFLNALIGQLKRLKLKQVISKSWGWFLFFLLTRNIFFRSPDYCFVAGGNAYNQFIKFYPKSKIVSVPSFDYYKYHSVVSSFENGKTSVIPSHDYVLYYDQSIFGTPDGRLVGRHQYITKDNYFKGINRFFEQIENVTGKKVVIAGSPKIRYEGHEFNGREILYNVTTELTYYADLIIMHTTTAFNYAVAMHKPVIFLKMEGLNKFSLQDIYDTASYLNNKVMDVDEDFDFQKLKKYSKINHEIYKNHVCNYMANEPFTVSPIEIVIETLNNCKNP